MKASKDQRYKAIKNLIASKGIEGLKEVFTIIPMSLVKQDMKINYNTLSRRIKNGEMLTVKDIVSMASLFEVDPTEVFGLILHDINSGQRAKKNKP